MLYCSTSNTDNCLNLICLLYRQRLHFSEYKIDGCDYFGKPWRAAGPAISPRFKPHTSKVKASKVKAAAVEASALGEEHRRPPAKAASTALLNLQERIFW